MEKTNKPDLTHTHTHTHTYIPWPSPAELRLVSHSLFESLPDPHPMIVLRTGGSDGCSLIRLIPVDIKKVIFLNLSAVFETVYNSIINVLGSGSNKPKTRLYDHQKTCV